MAQASGFDFVFRMKGRAIAGDPLFAGCEFLFDQAQFRPRLQMVFQVLEHACLRMGKQLGLPVSNKGMVGGPFEYPLGAFGSQRVHRILEHIAERGRENWLVDHGFGSRSGHWHPDET